MSDEQPVVPPAAPAADAAIQNLKAEFNRKLDNQASELTKITQLLQSKIQPTDHRTGQPASSSEDLSEIWYKDENKAAEIIVDRATKKMQAQINATQENMAVQQRTAHEIYKEFPEAQDVTHPLFIKADEIFRGYSDGERLSPAAMKLAVKEAALELNLKPKSKRDADSDSVDSFSLGSGNSRPAKRPSDKVSAETLDFAKRMGMDTSDPKVLERLKARAKNIG